jgi:uncharacterized protein YbaR (Trm112 family)/ubiquinone/menaquinone biosynthesis C-methylase UbiE
METRKNDILNLICCPITKSELRYLNEIELAEFNTSIDADDIVFIGGSLFTENITEALISEEVGLIYPVINDINYLLPKYALIKKDDLKIKNLLGDFNFKNQVLENFYEEFGWVKSENNNFNDAEVFEDLREVSKSYIHNCHMRIMRFLPNSGKYFLDAASGPIQFDEYLEYSSNFKYRVCIDLSSRALAEARIKIGNKGIYIIGNIANMPIKSEKIDAAVSLNTIYHIPKEEQLSAFKELHRVLSTNAPGLIIYEWGRHSHLQNLFVMPYKIKTHIDKWILSKYPKLRVQPDIYFHAFKQGYFSEKTLGFKIKTFVWRSISVPFMKMYVHKNAFGKKLLDIIYKIEEKFPRLAGNLGEYPMFYFTKE